MTNTLYLPELREMLAENNEAELREFCEALHPARTAEFMEGLTPEESWRVLQYAPMSLRVEIFGFFDEEKQLSVLELADRQDMAALIGEMPPDDRVDLLNEVDPAIVDELLPLVPAEERRDIQRLSAYPEGTAGAVMTTEYAHFTEDMSVANALKEITRQATELETIYYMYVVDRENHLHGLISARELLSAMRKPDTPIGDVMERDLVTVNVADDQEEVAQKVARYDLMAIPVVDDEHRMMGIITHDDVLDVMVEEAAEDAYRSAAVEPLEEGYLETGLVSLASKRGIWLTILFFAELGTAFALSRYEGNFKLFAWLVLFIPLVTSTGGNSGNQSATLVITALSTGTVKLSDWWRVVRRELAMGLLLGGALGVIGYCVALFAAPGYLEALVIPFTLLLVVVCGVLGGSVLPLIFRRLGLDPALMSNPLIAGMIDVLGIVIYMNVALIILSSRQ